MVCLTLLVSGCVSSTRPPIEVEDQALFCDVEEPRYFTEGEIQWRATNAPENLRKDLKTNKTGQRECNWTSTTSRSAPSSTMMGSLTTSVTNLWTTPPGSKS